LYFISYDKFSEINLNGVAEGKHLSLFGTQFGRDGFSLQ
jgi:hypothetical protein